ncbi:MAG: hypothetical protein A2583_03830 [Bdellovibrionales bacterium RIFOXYD1_FULL_53_11]|nr:MAG: hypothetical protein A2583_03830 [Bdellovibrionales bacterium RIFOXYD1_FULL_53_11]
MTASIQSSGVSVIIPTYNRAGYLENTVKCLLDQSVNDFEIIIVDQSDEPNGKIKDMQNAHPGRIKYHFVDFRGLPVARNFGASIARYPLLTYIDDDIKCGRDFLKEHVEAIGKSDAVAGAVHDLAGKLKNRGKTGRFDSWLATPHAGFDVEGSFWVDIAPGGNCTIKKSILDELGGFDEQLNVGAALHEETDFFLRLRRRGYRVLYNSRAALDHYGAPSGGCRTPDVGKYVWSLAHNRSLLIRRHVKWFQKPFAMGRLMLLILSYARSARSPAIISRGLAGMILGYNTGARNVHNSFSKRTGS